MCWPKVGTHARRYRGSGCPPQKILKFRCSEMRFQANPGGTILAKNDIELLCEARGSLIACWIILRLEIKVNNVHRIFRANFLL
jgi:hypothetical protein